MSVGHRLEADVGTPVLQPQLSQVYRVAYLTHDHMSFTGCPVNFNTVELVST